MEATKPVTFRRKRMLWRIGNRLLLTLSRRRSSPAALALLSFLSVMTLGLLYQLFTGTVIREHFPSALCKQATDVVVAVRSWPGNHATRAVIRNSMGNPAVRAVLPWSIVFYSGYTLNPAWTRKFRREIRRGDLIITPFEAHVRNGANIFLSAARSVYERCGPQLRFFIHINDSTMVNVLAMNKYIAKLSTDFPLIHCAVVKDVPADHNVNSSTYTNKSQLHDTHLPPHCEGDAFVVATKNLERLFLASDAVPQHYPTFGPYVTGHLADLARLGHRNISTKITALSNQPRTSTSTIAERPLFFTNVTMRRQWKNLWLWDLVCHDGDNITTTLKKRIVERIEIGVM